jgi:hypothetical protein
MLNPAIEIEIDLAEGAILQIPFANQVEVMQSLKEMTGTCIIRIAKKVLVGNRDIAFRKPLQEVLKGGMAVRVWMRYEQGPELEFNQKNLEFVGYIRNVNPTIPMEIECEDEMYKLKRKEIEPRIFSGGTVIDVIRYITQGEGYRLNVLNSSLGGAFSITRDENTAAKVLGKIEEVYGLKSNFRLKNEGDKTFIELVVGTQYEAADREVVKYALNKNVIDNSLVFTSADDKQVKVKVTSRQPDGKVLTSAFRGDSDGDSKELQIPGLNQAQVEAYARRLYEESKVDSFEGSMTTFGVPRVTPGMLANVKTEDFELKETTNYVDEVKVSFGVGGFRREVTLGPQLRQSGSLRLVAS